MAHTVAIEVNKHHYEPAGLKCSKASVIVKSTPNWIERLERIASRDDATTQKWPVSLEQNPGTNQNTAKPAQ